MTVPAQQNTDYYEIDQGVDGVSEYDEYDDYDYEYGGDVDTTSANGATITAPVDLLHSTFSNYERDYLLKVLEVNQFDLILAVEYLINESHQEDEAFFSDLLSEDNNTSEGEGKQGQAHSVKDQKPLSSAEKQVDTLYCTPINILTMLLTACVQIFLTRKLFDKKLPL